MLTFSPWVPDTAHQTMKAVRTSTTDVKGLVIQVCLTPCDHMDCSLPGSSVHGILQARILSGLPFPSPGDFPDPGVELGSPALQTDSLPSEFYIIF